MIYHDLKRCPFCASGHVALVLTSSHTYDKRLAVECVNCHANGPISDEGKSNEDGIKAISRWNKRRIETKNEKIFGITLWFFMISVSMLVLNLKGWVGVWTVWVFFYGTLLVLAIRELKRGKSP
ncbi:hypothetical protein GS501_00205 [Saccharibacter sp. 17.LH.SD]|uniref:Lar family restriction alleviation protein n=1 Tax=Saccharibacter sp. 17.LH.SD TaxID=2689393 RepID=UPI0013681BD3|nr:hypothetical protein [Saccharibacter sp. 17.LH.SD]